MLAFTILVSGMMFTPVDASAANGSWKSDGKGWWFEYPGGDYPSGQWLQISDSWYYFGNDGYMEAECYRDGCWLGSSGAWVPDYSNGHWCSDSVGWWYEDSGWYPTSQWLQIDGSCVVFAPPVSVTLYVGFNVNVFDSKEKFTADRSSCRAGRTPSFVAPDIPCLSNSPISPK